MSYNQFYYTTVHDEAVSRPRLHAPLPPTPLESPRKNLSPHEKTTIAVSPISSSFESELNEDPKAFAVNSDKSYFDIPKYDKPYRDDPFGDNAAIPLQTQYIKEGQTNYYTNKDLELQNVTVKRRKFRLTKSSPWFIYCLTLIQITVFIAELVRNSILTGSPIETSPQFNPMIGPSPYLLINMGARYVPCMRNQADVQNSTTVISWPCPWQTDDTPKCTLSQLCGFSGVPNPRPNGSLNETPAPNQWFRFVVPIFLHAGIIHIGFNMLLQVLLGGDMEKAIGPVRLALVYFSSGIFGFVMGGNFAASGIASTGASGCLFGIIALTLLDLLYTWSERKRPVRDLTFIIIDVVISFGLGLLPGLDNFSHIGGFLMGLVLGVCLLRSPNKLRERTGSLDTPHRTKHHMVLGSQSSLDPHTEGLAKVKKRQTFTSLPSSNRAFVSPRTFFSDRKPLWWAWWLIRAAALVGVVAAFIALVTAFYSHHNTECSWCKYLSCIPVNNWCDMGDLTFSSQQQSPSRLF